MGNPDEIEGAGSFESALDFAREFCAAASLRLGVTIPDDQIVIDVRFVEAFLKHEDDNDFYEWLAMTAFARLSVENKTRLIEEVESLNTTRLRTYNRCTTA